MNTDELREARDKILAEHPALNANGYELFPPDRYSQRELMHELIRRDDVLPMIGASIAYLEAQPRISPGRAASRNSYELKHTVEKLGDPSYVYSGALIAAALIMGIPIKVFPDNPNPAIGVTKIKAKRIRS